MPLTPAPLVEPSFEDIAGDFDRLFSDVSTLTDLEGDALHTILTPDQIHTVLDCACGTGIQAIGLARRGYHVSASDISASMVEITRRKAVQEGLQIETAVSDFRDLAPWQGRQFDAIVNSGNSLTLLAGEADIMRTLHTMLQHLRTPGGVGIVGMHNYLVLQEQAQTFYLRRVTSEFDQLDLVADLRYFGSERVEVNNIFLQRDAGGWHLKTYTKSYLLLAAEKLQTMMLAAGFKDVYLRHISGQRAYQHDEWVLAVGTR